VLVPLTDLVNYATYAANPELDKRKVATAIFEAHATLKRASLWRRAISAINPASITNALGGGSW
jgi:hypothetical protein